MKPYTGEFDKYNSIEEIWKKRNIEWVYLIVISNKIIKIGGTRDGLIGRWSSYTAGNTTNRKNGTCSTTNYIVYSSILNMVKSGESVDIYGFIVPEVYVSKIIWNQSRKIKCQTYTTYEKLLIEEYKNQNGIPPIL